MVDADHFGQVNKDHSQAGGDKVLEWLAGIFLASVRASDSVGRVGGEEFLVVAPATDVTGAETLAERLRSNVETSETEHNGNAIRMTLSLGVAVADACTATTYKDLYDAAADGLKAAKHGGRNKAVVRLLAAPPVA
jgi:diguanylate cyclase (GGDEF)-like protein